MPPPTEQCHDTEYIWRDGVQDRQCPGREEWGANAEVGQLKVLGASQGHMTSGHVTLILSTKSWPRVLCKMFQTYLVTLKPRPLMVWVCLPEEFIPMSEHESVTYSHHILEFPRAQALTLKQVLYAKTTLKKCLWSK